MQRALAGIEAFKKKKRPRSLSANKYILRVFTLVCIWYLCQRLVAMKLRPVRSSDSINVRELPLIAILLVSRATATYK